MPPVSKIALLPADIREWLHKAFVARGFGSIEQITEDLNALMKEAGVAITIGKSAVGEASKKYRRATESMAAVTRQMQAAADAAGDSGARRSEALNAHISTELFEALVDAQQAEDTADPADRIALLGKAALATARLTNASVLQQQHLAEVQKRTQAAAEKVSKLLKKGGMNAATVAEIRQSILGIVKREPAPAPAPNH